MPKKITDRKLLCNFIPSRTLIQTPLTALEVFSSLHTLLVIESESIRVISNNCQNLKEKNIEFVALVTFEQIGDLPSFMLDLLRRLLVNHILSVISD